MTPADASESSQDSPGRRASAEGRDGGRGSRPEASARARAEQYGLAFLDSLDQVTLDPALVADLPVEWARSHSLLPVRMEQELCALMSQPEKVSELEYLALLLRQEVRPVVAPPALIAEAIQRCYFSKKDSPGEFIQDLAQPSPSAARRDGRGEDLFQVTAEAPVTQLVNLILLEALKRGASDIHFEPFASRTRVRYRIDGILYEQSSPPKHMEESVVSRLKVMARMDIAEKRLPQEGVARVRVGEKEIDIRISAVPVAEGERVVLRLLDRDSALLPLEVLGMSPSVLTGFGRLLRENNGIVVVSGPTGSGKTTTLYAALSRLDAGRKNILTIEDPIEYQLPNIGQIQVKPKIGLTFASGLRHILRQDPDIVLVGETRDLETAEIAVRASLTGHLVFTTLHTNDAPSAVLRLVDMGVEPYLVAACLRGVLAQRLVRRLCPACRREQVLTAADVARVGAGRENLLGARAWVPSGCSACLDGYRGRVGLFELMEVGREMQDLIRTGHGDNEALRRQACAHGMRTLVEDGLDKVPTGLTSLMEVLSVAG